MSDFSTRDDDIGPIRDSLPEGPEAPVAAMILQWALMAAAGFSVRVSPEITPTYGIIQAAGLVAVVIAAGVSLYMLSTKSVIARISGGLGLAMSAGFLIIALSILRHHHVSS